MFADAVPPPQSPILCAKGWEGTPWKLYRHAHADSRIRKAHADLRIRKAQLNGSRDYICPPPAHCCIRYINPPSYPTSLPTSFSSLHSPHAAGSSTTMHPGSLTNPHTAPPVARPLTLTALTGAVRAGRRKGRRREGAVRGGRRKGRWRGEEEEEGRRRMPGEGEAGEVVWRGGAVPVGAAAAG